MNAGITTIGQSTKREGKGNKNFIHFIQYGKNFIHLKTLSYQGFYTLYTKNTEIKKLLILCFKNGVSIIPYRCFYFNV